MKVNLTSQVEEVTQRSLSDLFLKDLATPRTPPPFLPAPRGFTIRIGILQEPDYFPSDFSPSLLTRKFSPAGKRRKILHFLEVHTFRPLGV